MSFPTKFVVPFDKILPPPSGQLSVLQNTLDYTEEGVTKTMFTMRAGMIVCKWEIQVLVAFDGTPSIELAASDMGGQSSFTQTLSGATITSLGVVSGVSYGFYMPEATPLEPLRGDSVVTMALSATTPSAGALALQMFYRYVGRGD